MSTSGLLSPITINTLVVRNRAVMPSMLTNFATKGGDVTERLIHYYAERAKGGVGLVSIEGTAVEPRGTAFVRRRYGDQILTPQETIQFSTLFGHIIDSCSPFTATHSTGVAHMAVALGRLTGMGQDDLDTLFVAGMLHDIGKLGIPLALLEKPGQLTDEEFPKVKRHADLSRLWLDAVPGFERVSVWGGGHHERLDGKGYPLGLKGEEIPLPSRIMAIADVFTALTEDRPYRKGMTPPEALRIVKGMVKQGHLDGDLSRLLCDHADELDAVRASSQAEARRGFQALHDACAEPDERLRD